MIEPATPRAKGEHGALAVKQGAVLLVTDSLDIGGGEQHVIDVAMALRHRGDAVLVACSMSGPLRALLDREDIGVCVLGRRLVKRRVSLLFACRLRRVVRTQHPRLVHTHMYASGVAGMLATWRTGVPLVHTEHSEAAWRGAWARCISRCLYRRAVRVIAVSCSIQQRLIEQEGVPSERLAVIPCSVRPVAAENGERPSGLPARPVVGVVARLQPEKGVGDFLEAAVLVAREMPACSFVVVGDGPLRDRLTAQARHLGLASRVHFLGFRSDARALITAMDVLVVPSRSEGTPLVILEGMTAGVPVIATSVGGIPHQVRHGMEGLLVPVCDPPALSRAIVDLLQDPVRSRRFGDAGRHRATTRFRYDAMTRGIDNIYRAAESGPALLCGQPTGTVSRPRRSSPR